jgi:hypothetical protein
VLAAALRHLQQRAQLTTQDLGHFLRCSPATVSRHLRNPAGIGPESELGQWSVRLLRSCVAAQSALGSDMGILAGWLHRHDPTLRGVPTEVVQTVDGLLRFHERCALFDR